MINDKAIIDARQRDIRAAADQARLAREARQGRRARVRVRAAALATERAPLPAARPAGERRGRRFGLAWLFGAQ